MLHTIRTARTRFDIGTCALAVLALAACNDASPNSSAAPVSSAAPAHSASTPSADASLAVQTADMLVAPQEDPSEASAAEVMELHAFHHGGVARLVSLSLDTLGVAGDRQKAIDGIQTDLDESTAPARDAESLLLLALADGVAAGKMDSRAVDADLARFTTAVASRGPTSDALTKLHALLTPVERIALVDKVVAHWELSEDANVGEGEGKKTGRLATLTDEVGLGADQVAQIRTRLRAAQGTGTEESEAKLTKEFDARVRSFGAAFAAETYDARSLTVGDLTDSHLATTRATRMARFYEVVTPALTLAQRTEVATHLRACAGESATSPTPATK
jgi:hypothetical protein